MGKPLIKKTEAIVSWSAYLNRGQAAVIVCNQPLYALVQINSMGKSRDDGRGEAGVVMFGGIYIELAAAIASCLRKRKDRSCYARRKKKQLEGHTCAHHTYKEGIS